MLSTASLQLNDQIDEASTNTLTFRIHYWGAEPRHFNNPVHKHSFFEICYVWAGEGQYIDDAEAFPLQPGSLFVSRPQIWHQIRSEEGLQLLFVAFDLVEEQCDCEAYKSYMRLAETANFYLKNGSERMAADLWKAIIRKAAESPAAHDPDLRSLCGVLLASFPNTFMPTEPHASRASATKSPDKLIHLARQFIRDNLSRPLALGDVANYLHISKRHLSRLFRHNGGETFLECLNGERLRTAELLLKTNLYSIKEIAEATGFGSVHYFTRKFTQYAGCPPAAYRSKVFKDAT